MAARELDRYIRNTRSETVTNIRRVIKPKLRPSGFKVGLGSDEDLLICAFADAKRPMKIAGCFGDLEEVWGFTEDGVITDAVGGACVVVYFDDLCLEDLQRLERFVHAHKHELD